MSDYRSRIAIRPDTWDEAILREMWEQDVYRLGKQALELGPIAGPVVDIGAHIGAFTIFALEQDPTITRVIAVEPLTDNCALLREHVAACDLADRVVLAQCAVWGVRTRLAMNEIRGVGLTTAVRPFGKEGIEALSLWQLLDEYLAPDEEVGLLKLDCEGAEYPIIAGAAEDALKRCRRIAMEFHATSELDFGMLVAKLARWFKIETLGAPARGGMLWAIRY